MSKEQKYISLKERPLDEPVTSALEPEGSLNEAPIVAHIRALLCVFNVQPIPEDVSIAILNKGSRGSRDQISLKQLIQTWNSSFATENESAIARQLSDFVLGTFIDTIALSYGGYDYERRRNALTLALMTAMAGETFIKESVGESSALDVEE